MWCHLLILTYCFLLWILYIEKTSAEKHLMSGKIQSRHKRDVDILVECEMDCVADEEVGDYDVLLEYGLEEDSYRARRPYSSYMDYEHVGAASKCSYPCKIVKLSKTGDVNSDVGNQIVSIEEIDVDSVGDIIQELNSQNSNFHPSSGGWNISAVSKMKSDDSSSETPRHLKEDVEVRTVEPNIINNAISDVILNVSDALAINSSDTVLNLTDNLNLNTSEQAVNLTEAPEITSDQVLTTFTTNMPIIMVPKVIRLTVLEAEMVEAASLKIPPTGKTPSSNLQSFVLPVNNSANISLNYENATEQLQMKLENVTKSDGINATYSSLCNVNAYITLRANDSSGGISVKSENAIQRPLIKDESTTDNFLQKCNNSFNRVLSVDAADNAISTEKIDSTTDSLNNRNFTLSTNAISSHAMNEQNPSLHSSSEPSSITTTEKVQVSLKTEETYTEKNNVTDIHKIESTVPTFSVKPTFLEKVVKTNSTFFFLSTATPTTNIFSKASTNYENEESKGFDVQTDTPINMNELLKDNINTTISLDEFSKTTVETTLSPDYMELLKSLIVDENSTDSSSIEDIYSNFSPVFSATEGDPFASSANGSNYDFEISGNFKSNISSFPEEFQQSLLKKLGTEAKVSIIPQKQHSSTGITTLRKVKSNQTKEETSL